MDHQILSTTIMTLPLCESVKIQHLGSDSWITVYTRRCIHYGKIRQPYKWSTSCRLYLYGCRI